MIYLIDTHALVWYLEDSPEAEAAARVENAIVKALESGRIKSLSAGQMGMGTSEVGDLVAGLV